MKKVISITLSGMVFQIEEDALQKLSAYLESIKNYYGSDGKEICDDIEANIAEKLKGKHGDGQKVIEFGDVDALIAVMGTVEQMEDQEGKESGAASHAGQEEQKDKKAKRLYRDKANSILGGVCTGLAAYLSVDVVIVRLIFVVLTILNGIGIVIYAVMWLIVPLAKTSVQKLEMQGEPINLKNIEEAVKEKSAIIKKQGQKALVGLKEQKSVFMKIASIPIVLIEALIRFAKEIGRLALPVLRWSIGLMLAIPMFFAFIFASFWAAVFLFRIDSPFFRSEIPLTQFAHNGSYYAAILSSYAAFVFLFVVGAVIVLSILRRKWMMHWAAALILFMLIAMSSTIAAVAGFDLAGEFKQVRDKYISENTVTKSFDIKDFNSVSGHARGKLVIEKAPAYSIVAKGLKEDVEGLSFVREASSTDGMSDLSISSKPRTHSGFLHIAEPMEIHIGMPNISKLDPEGFWGYELRGFGFSAAGLGSKEEKDDVARRKRKCVPHSGFNWCESSQQCIRQGEEICETDINFTQEGFIRKKDGGNGEGLYLVYDGSNGEELLKLLEFDEKSLCGDNEHKIMCMVLDVSDYGLSDGQSVLVRGQEKDNIVSVREIMKE